MSCWQEVRDFEFRGSLHVGLTDIGWAAVIYSSYVFSVGKVITHAHPRLGALIMMHYILQSFFYDALTSLGRKIRRSAF